MVWLRTDRARWLGRAVGQATVYLALVLALAVLLHREGVVHRDALTPRTLLVAAIGWVVLTAYRAYHERTS